MNRKEKYYKYVVEDIFNDCYTHNIYHSDSLGWDYRAVKFPFSDQSVSIRGIDDRTIPPLQFSEYIKPKYATNDIDGKILMKSFTKYLIKNVDKLRNGGERKK